LIQTKPIEASTSSNSPTVRGEACSLHRCVECSLQESFLATETAIWLGITDTQPKIMAADAIQLGIPTYGQTTGLTCPYQKRL